MTKNRLQVVCTIRNSNLKGTLIPGYSSEDTDAEPNNGYEAPNQNLDSNTDLPSYDNSQSQALVSNYIALLDELS